MLLSQRKAGPPSGAKGSCGAIAQKASRDAIAAATCEAQLRMLKLAHIPELQTDGILPVAHQVSRDLFTDQGHRVQQVVYCFKYFSMCMRLGMCRTHAEVHAGTRHRWLALTCVGCACRQCAASTPRAAWSTGLAPAAVAH